MSVQTQYTAPQVTLSVCFYPRAGRRDHSYHSLSTKVPEGICWHFLMAACVQWGSMGIISCFQVVLLARVKAEAVEVEIKSVFPFGCSLFLSLNCWEGKTTTDDLGFGFFFFRLLLQHLPDGKILIYGTQSDSLLQRTSTILSLHNL